MKRVVIPATTLAAVALCATASASDGSGASAKTTPAPTWTADDPRLEWGPCPGFLPEGCGIAVLHGDPAQANADIFFRVPAGSRIVEHWHTSPERMVLVSGELSVTYQGQDTVVLRPGSYAYGPARLPHSATCAKGDACVLFIAFEAPVDAHPGQGGEPVMRNDAGD